MSEIYPVEDYFVYPSNDKAIKICFENGSVLEGIPTNRYTYCSDESAQKYADWIEGNLNMQGLSLELDPDRKYIQEDMKVLFVRPEAYQNTIDWYEELAAIKKHRKLCTICCTPEQFREQFDTAKYGWNYTVFYFDQYIKPADQMAYFKMLIDCYGKENGTNVLQQRLKIIHLGLMRMYNDFSAANDYRVDDELIEKALEGTHQVCYCRSLL